VSECGLTAVTGVLLFGKDIRDSLEMREELFEA